MDMVPEIRLERYRLGELPTETHAELRERLVADSGLRTRLQALAHSDEAIRADGLQWMVEGVAGRVSQLSRPVPRMRLVRWMVPAMAAVLLAVLIARSPEEAERIKGSPALLTVYRQSAGGSELLSDGASAHQGDLLRLGYKVAETRFGVIVSVDGRGVVTRHLPADGNQAARLDAGRVVLLDRAYELDDAPRWERFYLVTADKPFNVAPVLDAARSAAGSAASSLPLPPALSQSTLVLQKDTRP